MMSILGVTPLKDHFDPSEHLPGTPGIFDFSVFYFNLDSKVSLDSGNWIDGYAITHIVQSPYFSMRINGSSMEISQPLG
jgi:hypothetical protein